MTETAEQALERVYAHLSHLLDVATIAHKTADTGFKSTSLNDPANRRYLDDVLDSSAQIRAYQTAINEITCQRSYLEKSRSGILRK